MEALGRLRSTLSCTRLRELRVLVEPLWLRVCTKDLEIPDGPPTYKSSTTKARSMNVARFQESAERFVPAVPRKREGRVLPPDGAEVGHDAEDGFDLPGDVSYLQRHGVPLVAPAKPLQTTPHHSISLINTTGFSFHYRNHPTHSIPNGHTP